MYCKTLAAIRWDTGKARDMFSGMGRFKGVLKGKGRINSVIIAVVK